MTVYSSVLDLIGNTPMVDVSALSPHPGARILVKLDHRAVVGQHGHRPGDDRPPPRLPDQGRPP